MSSPSLEGKKLLLVEDNFVIALDARLFLEDTGAIVSVASTVREALDLIAQDAPDFAVLDVNLATENSFPVARRLHELGIPFIFATGYGEQIVAPVEFSPAPIITKPFKGSQLLASLAKARGFERDR